MILQEKIQKKAKGFSKLAPVFLEGAKFALENQWIDCNDKMPYEYQELLTVRHKDATVPVLTKTEWLDYFVQYMYYIPHKNKWVFSEGGGVTHWMPIPKNTEEEED